MLIRLQLSWYRLRKRADPDFGQLSLEKQLNFLSLFGNFEQLDKGNFTTARRRIIWHRKETEIAGWVYQDNPGDKISAVVIQRGKRVRKPIRRLRRIDLDVAFPDWERKRKAFCLSTSGEIESLMAVKKTGEASRIHLRIANELEPSEAAKRTLSGITNVENQGVYSIGYVDHIRIRTRPSWPRIDNIDHTSTASVWLRTPDLRDLALSDFIGLHSLSNEIRSRLEELGSSLPVQFSYPNSMLQGAGTTGKDWRFLKIETLTVEKQEITGQATHNIRKIDGLDLLYGSVMVKENLMFLTDSAMHPRLAFSSGSHEYLRGRYGFLDRCWLRNYPSENEVKLPGSSFLAIHRNSQNFYHAMIEVLPLIISASLMRTPQPVIINSELPETFKKFIFKTFTELEFIQISKAYKYSIASSIIPINRTAIYDTFEENLNRACQISSLDISLIRGAIQEKIPVKSSSDAKKIFISRTGNRSIINGPELEDFLIRSGYVTYYPEFDPLSEQITTVAYADEIIGIGGAALSLLVFAKAHKIVILQPPGFGDFTGFSDLCNESSHVTVLSGKKLKGRQIEHLHNSYNVSLSALKRLCA